MDVIYPVCCGLDVHQASVVACLRDARAHRRAPKTRTFGTTVAELTALRQWLEQSGCTHVAMESTGVYWKPVYNVLAAEGSTLTVQVINARQVKAMPGRKTDVSDAAWLAGLLQHGMLKPSYIPSPAQRQLRDLTRTRTVLQNERTAVINRLIKVLEDANIKLVSKQGLSELMGVSGRAILTQLLAGVSDPATLAELAKGKLRAKRAYLQQALAGRLQAHHRTLAAMHLEHIDFLDEQIAALDVQIQESTVPFAPELALLDTIPGIGQRLAEILLAEVGADMTPFPSAHHLASWAGMCPGSHRSAGKSRRTPRTRGSPHLHRGLGEGAAAASRCKRPGETAFADRYHRLRPRMGHAKALVAIGHSIILNVFAVLAHHTPYRPPQPPPLTARQRRNLTRNALAALRRAGYDVVLTPHPTPAAA